jgi:transposase
MDRSWLERELAAGRSIEALAREAGRHPSTVAYWVNKHGLASAHAGKHSARGALERAVLGELVERGMTQQQMAGVLGLGATTVRYWLKKHGLRTARAERPPRGEEPAAVIRRCSTHGYTTFALTGTQGRYRCKLCRSERVAARRRAVKRILVEEAGGCCQLCGYARCPGALQFHHLEPGRKAFGLATNGIARSLPRAREEARKCVLVRANCHAEIEAGIATMAASPIKVAGPGPMTSE